MGNSVHESDSDQPIPLGVFDESLEYWGGLCMRIQMAAENWWLAKSRRDRSGMADWHGQVSHALDVAYGLTCALAREGRRVGEEISALVNFMQVLEAAKAVWHGGRITLMNAGEDKVLLDPIRILEAYQCATRIRAHVAIQSPPGSLIHAGLHSAEQKGREKRRANSLGNDADVCFVILQGRSRSALVKGKKKALNGAQYAVIEALVQARPNGLTKDSLETIRTDARGILRRLRRDADWAAVIHMAEVTSGRYRVG